MNAVIYARYSSDNQREESITAQVRACKKYAEEKGYQVIKIYADEEKTGTNDNRQEFLDMIRDSKNGTFQVVIIHKLNRFARNRYDSAIHKRELRRNSARVESVTERLDDSPESIILESMLEGMAEYYSKDLAREVMKGMKENAYQGRHNGGTPPLGYDVDEKGLYLINEAEAVIIRKIFNMKELGHSYSQIIDSLNECGYLTKKGNNFGKNSLHDILRNKKYIGVYTFNRSASRNIDGKRNNHLKKADSEIIEKSDAFPPIIPETLFYRVQKKMDDNKRIHTGGRYKAKTEYLLSGLVFCGDCGFRMVGSSNSYHTRVSKELRLSNYYRCGNGSRTGKCKMTNIKKNSIERNIIDQIQTFILNDKEITAIAKKVYKQYLREMKSSDGENKYIEKELRKITKQINNLINAITEGGMIKPLVDQLKSLETQKATLEVRLQEWQLRFNQNPLKEEMIIDLLHQYKETLMNDPQVSRKIIGEFIEKIIVNKDNIETHFKMSVLLVGGGEGSRTPVRKRTRITFFERSQQFIFAKQTPTGKLLSNYLDKSRPNPPRIGFKPSR